MVSNGTENEISLGATNRTEGFAEAYSNSWMQVSEFGGYFIWVLLNEFNKISVGICWFLLFKIGRIFIIGKLILVTSDGWSRWIDGNRRNSEINEENWNQSGAKSINHGHDSVLNWTVDILTWDNQLWIIIGTMTLRVFILGIIVCSENVILLGVLMHRWNTMKKPIEQCKEFYDNKFCGIWFNVCLNFRSCYDRLKFWRINSRGNRTTLSLLRRQQKGIDMWWM